LVDDLVTLTQEKAEGKDGKPYFKFEEENTEDEELDPAIETKSVRNWR
jgi:hypothetical protein